MSAFVLHVSLPERRQLSWTVPEAVSGEQAHYLYDKSLKAGKGLRAGSRVYLWGTKRIGKHGLFSSGICLKPKDPALEPDKDHDAFMLIWHDQALIAPIAPAKIAEIADLKSLVEKIEGSTFLELFQLDEKQVKIIDALLNASADKQVEA